MAGAIHDANSMLRCCSLEVTSRIIAVPAGDINERDVHLTASALAAKSGRMGE